MQWERVLASFENAASSVHALLLGVTDWQAPGLGEWDIGGLGGHLIRAVSAPERYLELEEPVAAQVESAAGYFAAYLERRAQAPADLDAAVAARALDSVDEPSTIPVVFGATLERAMLLLGEIEPSRLVPTPFGAMRMGNYVRTRTFELVVHGFDLGHAGLGLESARRCRHRRSGSTRGSWRDHGEKWRPAGSHDRSQLG